MEHATAIHTCICGCGREVATPFRRDSWTISNDGVGVSLGQSIGNGALPCRSQYIIRGNRIVGSSPRRPTLVSGEFLNLRRCTNGSDDGSQGGRNWRFPQCPPCVPEN